jgi:hypothetical protein
MLMGSNPSDSASYYGRHAYNAAKLPQQKRPAPGANSALPWFNQKADRKLPWGNTRDIAPQSYRTDYSPETLREFEREPGRFGNLEFHQRIDHERYRHATAALRTRILLLINAFGHPMLMAIITVPVFLTFLLSWYHEDDGTGLISALINFWPLLATVYGPLIACNVIPRLLLKLFPNWLIKPDKGPKWEFNRRTGLVTVYHYDRKGTWGKTGKPEEEVAPFYEFDAQLTNEVIYPGGTVHTLYLVNRYHPIVIPVGNLIGKTSPEECYALWDMLQNFMDTSRPLPDIPLWEEHRPNDPVTAEHDRQTRRPPRYWRDMDKETWKQKNKEMGLQVLRLTTPGRPDIMQKSWTYQPRYRKRVAASGL